MFTLTHCILESSGPGSKSRVKIPGVSVLRDQLLNLGSHFLSFYHDVKGEKWGQFKSDQQTPTEYLMKWTFCINSNYPEFKYLSCFRIAWKKKKSYVFAFSVSLAAGAWACDLDSANPCTCPRTLVRSQWCEEVGPVQNRMEAVMRTKSNSGCSFWGSAFCQFCQWYKVLGLFSRPMALVLSLDRFCGPLVGYLALRLNDVWSIWENKNFM